MFLLLSPPVHVVLNKLRLSLRHLAGIEEQIQSIAKSAVCCQNPRMKQYKKQDTIDLAIDSIDSVDTVDTKIKACKALNAIYVDTGHTKHIHTFLLITFLIFNGFSIHKKFWKAET